ncbi:MAG: helix-turn-helix domain-containing protein, partial [Candidatus Omnitrophica bacterium]|nr:helix-turn-helix domain-containing protein [Candidatus Omnitrophota bacterium]
MRKNLNSIIGGKIKKLRTKFNLTQEELAKKLGIPRPSIS